MPGKTSALRIRIEPMLHDEFLLCCKGIDRPASQVLREFMRRFVEKHKNTTQKDLFLNHKDMSLSTSVGS